MTARFAKVPHWVLLADIPPRAVVLYGLLREHVNNDPENPLYGQAWPSQDTLAELLGVARRQTVKGLVADLERIGAVETRTVRAYHGGLKTYYVVVDEAPADYAGRLSINDTTCAEPHMAEADDDTTYGNPHVPTYGKPHMAMSAETHIPMCAEPHSNQTDLTRPIDPDRENQTELSCSPGGERASEAPSGQCQDEDESQPTPPPLPDADAYWLTQGREALGRLQARNSTVYGHWRPESVAKDLRLAFEGNTYKRQWADGAGLADLIQAPQFTLGEPP